MWVTAVRDPQFKSYETNGGVKNHAFFPFSQQPKSILEKNESRFATRAMARTACTPPTSRTRGAQLTAKHGCRCQMSKSLGFFDDGLVT